MGKLIVVIDDSPTVRKIVEITLGREGFEVKSFPDGIEAFKWMTSEQTIPNLVLVDIGLPRMDGYEVTRRLKAKSFSKHVVVVIVTRRDGLVDRLKGRIAGAQEYIIKPFQTEHLLAVVKSLIGEAS